MLAPLSLMVTPAGSFRALQTRICFNKLLFMLQGQVATVAAALVILPLLEVVCLGLAVAQLQRRILAS